MKTFARTTTFLLSLFFVLFSPTLLCANTVYCICDGNGNKGSYDCQKDVARIYGTIYSQAAPYGYGYRGVENAHGSLLCRGDVHPDDCKYCYLQTCQVLQMGCPDMIPAFGYSDYCSLLNTYNNTDSLELDLYYCDAGNIVPNNQQWFSDILSDVFHHVTLNAPEDPKYMSSLQLDLGDSNTLYVYGQCNNGITADSCLQCLGNLRFILSKPSATCAYGFVGGRLVAGSCVIRYELYPFIGV